MKQERGNSSLLLLVIVLVIGALLGAYYLGAHNTSMIQSQPSVDPVTTVLPTPSSSVVSTNSWKTYTSTKKNFSLQYPTDWNAEEIDPDGLYIFSPDKAKDNQKFNIIVNVSHNLNAMEMLIPSYWPNKKITSGTTINGIKFSMLVDPYNEYPFLIGQVGDKLITIQSQDGLPDGGSYYFDKTDPIFMKNIETFNEIANTFKLTNETSGI